MEDDSEKRSIVVSIAGLSFGVALIGVGINYLGSVIGFYQFMVELFPIFFSLLLIESFKKIRKKYFKSLMMKK